MSDYKVLVGKRITVRDKAEVAGTAKGTLASGDLFEGIVKVEDANQQWVQITKCETKPQYVGFFAGVKYKGEVFAEVVNQPDPTPEAVYPPVSFSFDFNDEKTLKIFSDVPFETIIYNGQVLKDASEG